MRSIDAGVNNPSCVVAGWSGAADCARRDVASASRQKACGEKRAPPFGERSGRREVSPARETRRRRTVTGIAQRVVVPCRRLNAGSRFGRR